MLTISNKNVMVDELSFYWNENIFLRRLFFIKGHPILSIQLVMLIWFIIGFNICLIEGTIIIPGPNVGIFEDVPFLVLLFLLPLLMITLIKFLKRLVVLLHNIPHFFKHQTDSTQLKSLHHQIKAIQNFVNLQNPRSRKYYFFLLSIWAVLVVVFQIYIPIFTNSTSKAWTITPSQYPLGYIFGILWNIFVYVIVVGNASWYGLASAIKVFYLIKQSAKNHELVMFPVASDKKGGLSDVGNFSLALTMMVSTFLLLVVAWLLLYGVDLALFLGLLLYLCFLCVIFLGPLLSIHWAMKRAKSLELIRLANIYQKVYTYCPSIDSDERIDLQIKESKDFIDNMELLCYIDQLYSRVELMPVWPLSAKTFRKFFSLIFFPLLFAIIQMATYNEMSLWIQRMLH